MPRPTFTLTVPSRGVLYEGKLPGGTINYHPMTTSEEKLLTGGSKNGVSIVDSIIKACLPDSPVNVDEMLINDKYFILLVLRAQSYGSSYKFPVKCGDCDRKFTHEVNLGFADAEEEDGVENDNVFYVKTLADDVTEPFTVKLPSSGDTVRFRLLRGRDEKQIARFAESIMSKGKVEGDPSYIYRLAKYLVSVNDKELDSLGAQEYVKYLIGMDSIALRNAFEKADCGVDSTVKATCPFCDEVNEFSLPMTPEFFRPRA